jgi:uncharacterized lipoprotein NlpE involved in copper resistance
MRKLFLAFLAAVLLLCSCKKELSLENPDSIPGGSTTTGTGLLTRMVSVAGADSSVNDYGYDAAGHLITVNYTSTRGGNQYTRLYRNSAGVLTKFTIKSDDLDSAGIDSIETVVTYNSAQGRYAYGIATINFSGVVYTDSTVYNYDNNGALINKTTYAKAGPSNYQLYSKNDYSYNTGNNIGVEKYYTFNGTANNFDLEATYNYTYDDKVNPLQLGAEGPIVLDDVSYAGPGNANSFQFIDNVDPTNNFSTSTTFTYNSLNKPSAGTVVEDPGGGTYDLRYYYN